MPPALLDTNVLVHATYRASRLNPRAAQLVDQGLRQRGLYCIAPQNIIEFCAVVTRTRLVMVSLPAGEVGRIARLLYRSRNLRKIYASRGTVDRAVQEGERLGLTGARWYDLFLAQTMRDNSVDEIVTEDVGDFGQIPFVTVRGL